MWTLDKPLLADAIADIAKVVAASNDRLSKDDGVILNYLYKLYDKNGGFITKEDDDKLCTSQKNELYRLYDNQTYKGQKLYYIRNTLFEGVSECPMCGFGEISQLDHQMPRSDYKSLSVCRLNLIPTCGVCNNKKRKKDPTKFVHPYYDHSIKDVPFFLVDVNSIVETHQVYWSFRINEGIVGDDKIIEKINYQIESIDLYNRIYKETNNMLSDMLSGMEEMTQPALDSMLRCEYRKHSKRRGVNDWHTVFVKALIDSPYFTIEEAKVFAQQ